MPPTEDGLPIEEFVQALTSQLDRAQAALSVKARFGLPLTFAVKDISIDLRAHVSVNESQVRIMPVGPGDAGGSVIHLALTTITRPMIEENSMEIAADEPTLQEVLGDEITQEEQRRLEWAGIRTVTQLRELEEQSGEHVVEQIAQIPALRLRSALRRASQPHVESVRREGTQLRIAGRNLRRNRLPDVRIGNRPARVLSANAKEVVVEPPEGFSGMLAVQTDDELIFETELSDEDGTGGNGLIEVVS